MVYVVRKVKKTTPICIIFDQHCNHSIFLYF
nr:MAG TPA: hypothetical protein [Caudoviricetes sp.]